MRLAVAFFCLLLFSSRASAQPFFRKAAQVVPVFYELYDISNLPFAKIQWEKRNHSWYVYEFHPDSGQVVHLNRQLFYDAGTGKFMPLTYPKRASGWVEEDVNTLLDGAEYNFDVHSSYGYRGWYNDVIRTFSKKDTLSIDETYSLARAYSSAANARLSNQFGDAVPTEVFTQRLAPNCLSEQQVDDYLMLCKKAIDGFESVLRRNPGFETLVGKIARKAANERMVAFHQVMVYATRYLQKVSLPENLYEPEFLDSVRTRLSSCPRQAVLLSFGDNDFYPVLYLQAKGVRQDVHLINISLMGLDRYIYFSTHQPWFRAKPIVSSLDTADYKGERNNYRMLNVSSPVDMLAVVKAIKRSPETMALPSNQWRIRSSHGKSALRNTYIVKLPPAYALKEEMVLLDILDRLNGRKFCIPNAFDERLADLNRFFLWDGKVGIFRN